MNRVRLYYKDLSEIVGSKGFSVVRLTDVEERRAICVVCDKSLTDQLTIRINRQPGRELMLPEVLMRMLTSYGNDILELIVYDICDGQYRVSLLNRQSLTVVPIRMSDAVLLHFIAHVPLYIEEELMNRQASPYTPNARGISIPINTLDTEHLNRELERAIAEENYRLASHLHEEIQRRNRQ